MRFRVQPVSRFQQAAAHAVCRPLHFVACWYDGARWVGAGHDVVLSGTVGEQVDYGALFAYCFGRFGAPNADWAASRHLARYVLTTPLPDLWLAVTPTVDGERGGVFTFLAPAQVVQDSDAFLQALVRRRSRVRRAFWARPRRLRDWPGDDPLRPYARAAVCALRDMTWPLRGGGGRIDVFGALSAR